MAGIAAVLLAGCTSDIEKFYDSKLSLDQPIDWWHQLQGGPIASERPPPPGVGDPYPNFAIVPAKPVPTDAATRAGLSAQLAGQRDRARLLAAQDPVVFPATAATAAADAAKPPAAAARPPAAPSRPSAATPAPAAAPPADDEASTMTLDAASAVPAAPRTRAAAVPMPAPDPAPPAAFLNPPPLSGPVASGPIPALPTAAPSLPNLPGLPTADAAPVVARPRASAAFRFAAGSAVLPPAADEALRELAVRAAGGPIAVTAGGDAASTAPAAQGAALPLALRRTGAMTAVLLGAGVSGGALRVEAVASGRDGSARLVD